MLSTRAPDRDGRGGLRPSANPLAFDCPVATRMKRNMSLTSRPINHGAADVGTSVRDEVW
jgi:hypothetical protein